MPELALKKGLMLKENGRGRYRVSESPQGAIRALRTPVFRL